MSYLARDLTQNREVSRAISYSIIELVESTSQVWEIIVGFFLKANSLYCRQLILIDLAHQIPRLFVSRCNFSNSIVKKQFFSLSSCRSKEELVRALSSPSISHQCSLALIVPSLLILSSDCNSFDISSLAVRNKFRNCFRE